MSKMRLVFFTLILFHFPFSAYSLKESEISQVYELLNEKNLYTLGDFKGEKNINLRYMQFGSKRGSKGSLIFLSGRAENVFKYIELFYDLYLKGWSPIYTYDHRGQGFSDRLLPNSNLGYVEDYSYYQKDWETFIRLVSSKSGFDAQKNFVIAHSMGGTIVLDYLQQNPNQDYFSAVVLAAPMLEIKHYSYPIIGNLIFQFAKIYCMFDCIAPISTANITLLRQKHLTNSKVRFQFFYDLETKIFPKISSNHPTYHWTLESSQAGRKVISNVKDVQIPILLLQAEQELLVSNYHQDLLCSSLAKCCHKISIPGKHEIFMETDIYRDQAIQDTDYFFSKNQHYKNLCLSK